MEENRCRARSVIGEVEKSVVGKTDILRKHRYVIYER